MRTFVAFLLKRVVIWLTLRIGLLVRHWIAWGKARLARPAPLVRPVWTVMMGLLALRGRLALRVLPVRRVLMVATVGWGPLVRRGLRVPLELMALASRFSALSLILVTFPDLAPSVMPT